MLSWSLGNVYPGTTIPLEKETFEDLVISQQTDQKFKETIVKYHGAKLMSETVAEQVCSTSFSISKEVFDAAWDILDVSKKRILMLSHMNLLKAEDFEVCFSMLGKPYHELTDRSRRHNVTIPDSEGHRKLAKRLQQVDYITSYECTGSVKEYDFKQYSIVDRPVILCRVKADISKSSAKK